MLTPEEIERLKQWLAVARDASYYEILGVLEVADPGAIKDAYHQFALAFHPDNHPGAPPGARRVLGHLFQLGAEAYRVLSDPHLRSHYDRVIAEGVLRLPRDRARTRPRPSDLEAVGRTPAARYLARRAGELLDAGRPIEARQALTEAWARDDYDNPELEQRIESLDTALSVRDD